MSPQTLIRGLVRVAFPLLCACAPITGLAQGPVIERINTDQARYAPGEVVTIYLDLRNALTTPYSGSVTLYFRHLGEPAGADQSQMASVPTGAMGVLVYQWQPPVTDFRGYLVEAWARNASGVIVDYAVTAVDVSSTWTKFPRYGYLTRFSSGDDVGNLLWQMKNYHVNGVQFYDWMDSHHRPFCASASWDDLSRQPVSGVKLQTATGAARAFNMQSMAYNLMNGAYDGYWADGSGVQLAWGLFLRAGGSLTPADQDYHPLPASWETSKLYQMNPASLDWQSHLSVSMGSAMDQYSFDGWHIDTLGYRGNLFTWEGNTVPLDETFPSFVSGVKSQLDAPLLVNIVGGYGRETVPGDPGIDFIYNELWDDPDTDDYHDLKTLTESYWTAAPGRAVVYAAYMNHAYAGLVGNGFFNEPSVLLANAAMFASGAAHMELGNGLEMVSGPYFPATPLQMSGSLQARLLDYYHFLTAYQNLLRDGVEPSNVGLWLQGASHSYLGEQGPSHGGGLLTRLFTSSICARRHPPSGGIPTPPCPPHRFY